MKFPKHLRLRKRSEFLRVSARHQRLVGQFLIVERHRRQEGSTRLGITVTRRFGNAPCRNRFKRLVREAFRSTDFPPNFDLVIRPRSAATDATAGQIKEELKSLTSAGSASGGGGPSL